MYDDDDDDDDDDDTIQYNLLNSSNKRACSRPNRFDDDDMHSRHTFRLTASTMPFDLTTFSQRLF